MENMESVGQDLDLAQVHAASLRVVDYLDLLAEEGFTEVEIVTAMFLIGAKLSEALEGVSRDDS